LTAITDPLSTALPGGEATGAAILTYDALALENNPGAQAASGITGAEATPTVFYKREGGGRLSKSFPFWCAGAKLPRKYRSRFLFRAGAVHRL
jgi:hypothetical protein